MNIILQVCIVVVGLAFLFYGYNCLFSNKLAEEFKRFKLSDNQRKITGIAQLAGGLGLIIGVFYYSLGIYASLCLSILMLFGFIVRLKIKDSFIASSPSFILMVVNIFFTYRFGALLHFW